MGVYNPHVPYVLGQEWVPIREENFQFQPNVTSREVGYGFSLTASRQLSTARFYVNSPPPASSPVSQTAMVNIYPRGQEAASGPIRKVVIPVNNGAVTGSFITINGGAPASSLADAVALPNDLKWVQCTKNTVPGNTQSGAFNLFFATNDYSQVLVGKRILNVNLLYSGWGKQSQSGISIPVVKSANSLSLNTIIATLQIISSSVTKTYGPEILGTFGSLKDMGNDPIQIASDDGRSAAVIAGLNLGDVCSAAVVTNGPATPWTFATLQKLDARNGINGFINILVQVPEGNSTTDPNSVNFFFGYFALEITYCEETRVAAGAQAFGYQNGVNLINMADLNLNANPILAAGDYTATLSFVNPGDLAFIGIDLVGPYAPINAIREKYQLGTMPGLEVDIPFPANERAGDSFSTLTTHIIPQLSLHASGAPLTEPHVYGRQAVAQVYGNITATQNLLDSAVGGNQSFPWVRFYARRFGSTTTKLTLTGTSPTVSGSSVSITPPDFDALPEILDGWREVTLRFPVAPTMGAGVTPSWTWSATGELAGNRWEVLGASAPAISGTVANEYVTLAPPASQLSTATYGQPAAGSTVAMTWMPGIAPILSGSTLDATSDAVILFSQDMPAVTGLTVTVTNQPLTGIALDCANYPWYIPTSMAFNQLNWTPTSGSVPVTGFGYYEIQRSDTIDTNWATIAQISPPGSFSFRDFEARIGIVSSYRIRSVNSLLFAGAWSSTVSSTLTSPGVTGTGINSTSRTLIFTSNEVQTGARTLAYAMAFDNDTTEQFNFPEAGFTQFQFMYGRDYQTAFRPMERGGTVFQRTVLVNAAAISPPTLADFKGLRDMMWDPTLSYICVRDEDGNRWFANVGVPTGNVKMNNRELYLADLTVTEVTGTPSSAVYPVIVLDTFQRTSVNTPGNADIGGAWTTSGGAASDYQVTPGALQLTITAANTSREVQIGNSFTGDQDTTMLFTVPAVATGADMETYLFARRFDGSNYYRMELHFKTTGLVDFDLERVGSSPTFLSLASGAGIFSYAAGDQIGIRIQCRATLISVKAWNETTSGEPVGWTAQGINGEIARGGTGLRVVRDTGNTNTNPVFSINYFRTI